MKKKIITIVIVALMIFSICSCCFTIFQQTFNIIEYVDIISNSGTIIANSKARNVYYYLFSSIFAIIRDLTITSCIVIYGIILLHFLQSKLSQEIECQILARVELIKEKVRVRKNLKTKQIREKNLLQYQKKTEKIQQKIDKLNQENE